MDEVEGMLAEAHDWVKVVPNRREESLAELTPEATFDTPEPLENYGLAVEPSVPSTFWNVCFSVRAF